MFTNSGVLDLVAFGLGVAEPTQHRRELENYWHDPRTRAGIHRSDCAAAANHIETFCFGDRQLCGAQY